MTHLDDDDLRALIDGSFGDGPPAPPIGVALGAGHRAIRRRRAAALGCVLAAVLVAGGGGLVLLGGHDSGRAVDPATPALVDGGYPVVTSTNEDFLEAGDWVQLTADAIEVRPGVTIVRQVTEPFDRPAPDWSVGLVARFEGRERWLALDYQYLGADSAGTGGVSTSADGETGTFEQWLAEQVERDRQAPASSMPMFISHPDTHREIGTLSDDGTLRLDPGVTLLQRVDDPFGTDDQRQRSIALSLDVEGRTQWVFWSMRLRAGHVTGASGRNGWADEFDPKRFETWVAGREEGARIPGPDER